MGQKIVPVPDFSAGKNFRHRKHRRVSRYTQYETGLVVSPAIRGVRGKVKKIVKIKKR
jgi:hypothetical protein